MIGNRKLTVGDAVRLARSHSVPQRKEGPDALLSPGIARLAPAEHRMRGYGLTALARKTPRAEAISLRALERLARKMYETKLPGHAPWPRCGWDVRQVWLKQAKQESGNVGSLRSRRPLWREIKSWLRPSEHNGARAR